MGRQALHTPSPPETSALAATSSEEEGLHARPLPHTFGEYFCVDAAYHGGGRIGTLPSSSQWRGVLRRRRDWPFSSQRPCVRRLLSAVSAGCSWTSSSWVTDCRFASANLPSGLGGAVAQMERSGGPVVLGCLVSVHSAGCSLGTLCEPCGGSSGLDRPDWTAGGRDAIGDTFRLGQSGTVTQMGRSGGTMVRDCLASCTRVQVYAARDALRYHAVGVLVVRGQTGLVCRRSGRLRRYHPSGSVCTRSCVGLFALRSTSPVCGKHQVIVCWRSDYCWFGSEQVGDGCGSDPGGTASHLAHITKCRSWVGHLKHHTARSDTPCREKTTEWYTCMGGAARC